MLTAVITVNVKSTHLILHVQHWPLVALKTFTAFFIGPCHLQQYLESSTIFGFGGTCDKTLTVPRGGNPRGSFLMNLDATFILWQQNPDSCFTASSSCDFQASPFEHAKIARWHPSNTDNLKTLSQSKDDSTVMC